jgi:putative SOS response-associated peptidase YedK
MCGRFVQFSSLRTLEEYFNVQSGPTDIVANYNVAPTQKVLAVIHGKQFQLEYFHWGLVPSWAKNLSGASRLINARAETVATKPSFRAAFKRRRCLILADGFYEWQGEKGHKQPWFISLSTDEPLAFAGLWETWKHTDTTAGQDDYRSCTIITTEASQSVRDIHHRMPAILRPDAFARWLNPENQDKQALEAILHTENISELKSHPVSKQVNRVQNNSPSNIEPANGSI